MPETFGQLIARYLAVTGWTRAELARRTGFSKTYIGNLVQDRAPTTRTGKPSRLPAQTVDKISQALGIPADEARRAAGLASVAEAASSDLSPVESTLLLYFRALPPEQQTVALAYLGTLYLQEKGRPIPGRPLGAG